MSRPGPPDDRRPDKSLPGKDLVSSMVDATKRTAAAIARRPRASTVRQESGDALPVAGNGSFVELDCGSPSSLTKYDQVLAADTIDLEQLRQLAWHGVPSAHRPLVWRLLMGYTPCSAERRDRDVARKQREYADYVAQYYDPGCRINDDGGVENAGGRRVTEDEITTRRQIHIDLPRTNPDMPLYQLKGIQQSLERILYVWSVRHPAAGYVQGLNDLATPFLTVFLAPHIRNICTAPLDEAADDLRAIPEDAMREVEASAFWCFSKLLDSIQDHYTFAQPGIQRMIHKLRDIVRRIDSKLYDHLGTLGVDFLQFSFRWINCLFLRELPVPMAIRLWDTYLAEGDAFPSLHVYFCAAYLTHWSDRLQACAYTDLIMLLQALPHGEVGILDLEMLISKAYMWRALYDSAPNHLQSTTPA
jgi:hypothetical protein